MYVGLSKKFHRNFDTFEFHKMPAFSNFYSIHRILLTTISKPQKRTLCRNMANNEVPSSKLARKRQSKTARPKVTVEAGIANVAASLSSFAIQQRTGVALESSLIVFASSPLPICVSGLSSSTTQPTLSFIPASLISALQEPVPWSTQFSSPSPCAVTPVSPVSTFSTACAWVCPIFIYDITASI